MNFYILLLLAVGLSIDSLMISIAVGCQRGSIGWRGLRFCLIMGVMHFLFLWVGWLVGAQIQGHIERWDHWLAFLILALVGGRMIRQAMRRGGMPTSSVRGDALGLWGAMVVAMATSIDALLTGGALSLEATSLGGLVPEFIAGPLNQMGLSSSHLVAFVFIGLVVVCVSLLGLLMGRGLGRFVGRWGGILGGCALILVGLWILLSHLGIL